MNALNDPAVDRSLDSEMEMNPRFRPDAAGGAPVFSDDGTDPEPVVSTGDSLQETPGARSSRSMWRAFFGWMAPVGRQGADGDARSGEPALPQLLGAARASAGHAATTDVEGVEPAVVEKRGAGILAKSSLFGWKGKIPMQAKFRFENVQVVCNELHDTDFIIKT